MQWRRTTGGLLAALVLLSVALPAMCGECFGAARDAREKSCSETHGAIAGENRPSDAFTPLAAQCSTCDSENQIPEKKFKNQTVSPELVAFHSAPKNCSDSFIPNALLAEAAYLARHRTVTSGTFASASVHDAVHKVHALRESMAVSSNKSFANSSHQPLLVILKV